MPSNSPEYQRNWYRRNRKDRQKKKQLWRKRTYAKKLCLECVKPNSRWPKVLCADCNSKASQRGYKYKLKKLYGLTIQAAKDLWNKQKQCCAICREPLLWAEINVDHSHSTGSVRGLVHKHCNVILGFARENPKILEGAINYLRQHKRGTK